MTGRPVAGLRRRGTRALTALICTTALTLGACSGDEESAPPPEEQSTPPAPAQLWPFTGRPVDGRLPAHRAAVVKIDNTANAQPQVGLGSADMVFEQVVEGGITRLAAVYYSRLPDRVGPVRSMRATDIGIVQPTGGVLAASGGAPITERRIREAGIDMLKEGGTGYSRDSGRAAPYNLFLDLASARAKLKGPRPRNYLHWSRTGRLPGGQPARHVSVQFSPGSTTEWTWQGKRWERAISYAADGNDFAPVNVLVLRVNVVDAGYRDPAGNPVPESVFSGRGDAILFSRGKALQAEWAKPKAGGTLALSSRNKSLRVPSGPTWIELVPKTGGDVQYGKTGS